ncbi:esterase/lipase family protein [Tsukamurella sp. DT100]|uniref:esterase/lipase family protein n=1 Tax=Tsukamurella sp. DT100 TaxID=3393415 RepID=UPI003CE8DD6D
MIGSVGAIAVAVAVATSLGGTGIASAAPVPVMPDGGLQEALLNFAAAPDSVRGANDWTCMPNKKHPNPVILLHGTLLNAGANFVRLAPRLRSAGYCAYAFNFGMTTTSAGRLGGLGPITTSAKQLESFVGRVRTATGAPKVDIVGHSQGGNVPMWWMKKLGGAAQVAHYVGWAPSSHGTTFNGLFTLAQALDTSGFSVGLARSLQFTGMLEQMTTSTYTKELWADGDQVPPGPRYTTVITTHDAVVTPYQSQRLRGADVNNIILQERCPADPTGHTFMFLDGPTIDLTMNALADGPDNYQPRCGDYSPIPAL